VAASLEPARGEVPFAGELAVPDQIMQEPEAREGSIGALKDLTGPDLNVQRPSVPPESAEVHAGKPTAADAAAARDSQRRSGRTRTMRVRDGFFDSSLL
jgi:hypothetical protein